MGILQGTIPSDWEGEYCRYAVCWPNSPMWLAVLRGVLSLPARGRFWDEHTGIITEAQTVMEKTADTNLHLKGVIMACGDTQLHEIALALRALADAQCCATSSGCPVGGSAGAGFAEPPFSPIIPGDPLTDDPPEGFDSWDEFFHDKCAVAYSIITELQASLLRVGVLNFGALSLDALGIALSIALTLTVPAAIIIAIAGLLISAGAEIVVVTLLSIVNDNVDDLICALYEGENAEQSSSLFHSTLGGFIDSGVTDPIENYAIKTLAGYLVNAQAVNALYEKDLSKAQPDRDCSMCGPNGDFRQGQANGLDFADWNIIGSFEIGVPYELTSQLWEIPPASDAQAVVLELSNNQITATFEQSAHVQYTIEGCGDYRAGSGVGGGHAGEDDIYCEIYDLPTGELTFGNITFYSLDPASFTLTITRTA